MSIVFLTSRFWTPIGWDWNTQATIPFCAPQCVSTDICVLGDVDRFPKIVRLTNVFL